MTASRRRKWQRGAPALVSCAVAAALAAPACVLDLPETVPPDGGAGGSTASSGEPEGTSSGAGGGCPAVGLKGPLDGGLLQNPSFEVSLDDWNQTNSKVVRAYVEEAPNGTYVARAASELKTMEMGLCTDDMKAAPGTKYVATAWVRSLTNEGAKVMISLRVAAGSTLSEVTELSRCFTKMEVSGTVPADPDAGAPPVRVCLLQLSANMGDTFDVDVVQVLEAP